jgi:hypothetical protein
LLFAPLEPWALRLPTRRILSCDESMLDNGRWIPGRRLNGDETGHNTRWSFFMPIGIYKVKVYRRD